MKRILWAAIVFFVVNVAVYAQVRSSAEIKQVSQQMLNQQKTNSSQFNDMQANLKARNQSNSDAATCARLKRDVERLEALIKSEQSSIETSLDSGRRVSSNLLDKVQRLIEQHQAVLAEIEGFIAQ